MSWPQDEDGDVFRSLEQAGFDFAAEVLIDFNVDVDDPAAMLDAIGAVLEIYPDAGIGEEDNYFVVQLIARLTYDLVIEVQRKLTAATAKFSGQCDSWAVLH
jgi:hypothetical protein